MCYWKNGTHIKYSSKTMKVTELSRKNICMEENEEQTKVKMKNRGNKWETKTSIVDI